MGDKKHAMSQTPNTAIAVIGIDIGKNSFHVMGHDARGNARPVHTDVPIPEDRWLSESWPHSGHPR
jgi:hypothetical protein